MENCMQSPMEAGCIGLQGNNFSPVRPLSSAVWPGLNKNSTFLFIKNTFLLCKKLTAFNRKEISLESLSK